MMNAVMVGLPGAAQDRLPADVPGTRPGCPGVPRRPGEGCRAARAPARERGAAPARRPDTVSAGRPGVVRRAGTAPPSQALDRHLPRDTSDAAGLAPQTGRQQIRHEQAAQARPPADGPGHRPPGRSPGEGESAVGTPPDPRRADQARRDGRTEWTVQQARNLALTLGERFADIKFVIRDRGSNFTASFDAVFQATGPRILRTA